MTGKTTGQCLEKNKKSELGHAACLSRACACVRACACACARACACACACACARFSHASAVALVCDELIYRESALGGTGGLLHPPSKGAGRGVGGRLCASASASVCLRLHLRVCVCVCVCMCVYVCVCGSLKD